jgi:O-acetyl-ADP-ribose deacetylase (regulator of RNase III)
MDIVYKTGDATYPEEHPHSSHTLILHGCNDEGRWGKGFVLALSWRWKQPEEEYLKWARDRHANPRMALGLIQPVWVTPRICVVNCITQRGIRSLGSTPPIRYDAMAKCFDAVVARFGDRTGFTPLGQDRHVHMPRIGAGLAGGNWGTIAPLIRKHLCDKGYPVTVYAPPK